MSIKNRTINGIIWSFFERFSVQGIQFLFGIFIARVLSPSDFGMIGMLTFFLAISQIIIDSGFSNALIQKSNRTDADFYTVFYFSFILGIVMYFMLYISASFIAQFYNITMLESLTKVLSLNLIISSLSVVQRAVLTIKLDFKTQAKISLISVVVGGILGFILAYQGFGVWSLVFMSIVINLLNTSLLWVYVKWIPKFFFSFTSFKPLFTFGSKLMMSGLIDTVYRNLYLMVIGKKFSSQDLGYYTRADQLSQFPAANLGGIVDRVLFPVLCDCQYDNDKLQIIYRKFLKLSCYLFFPIMTLLAVIANPLIRVVLTEKWIPASGLLQILCFAYILYPVHLINLSLLKVKGRSDLFLKLEVFKKVIGVIILIFTIPFGISVMSYGLILISIISLIINTYYTGKYLKMSMVSQMLDILPLLLMSFIAGLIAFVGMLLFKESFTQIFVASLIIVVTYVILSFISNNESFRELLTLFKKKIYAR